MIIIYNTYLQDCQEIKLETNSIIFPPTPTFPKWHHTAQIL